MQYSSYVTVSCTATHMQYHSLKFEIDGQTTQHIAVMSTAVYITGGAGVGRERGGGGGGVGREVWGRGLSQNRLAVCWCRAGTSSCFWVQKHPQHGKRKVKILLRLHPLHTQSYLCRVGLSQRRGDGNQHAASAPQASSMCSKDSYLQLLHVCLVKCDARSEVLVSQHQLHCLKWVLADQHPAYKILSVHANTTAWLCEDVVLKAGKNYQQLLTSTWNKQRAPAVLCLYTLGLTSLLAQYETRQELPIIDGCEHQSSADGNSNRPSSERSRQTCWMSKRERRRTENKGRNPVQWKQVGGPTRDDGGEDGSAAQAEAVPEHEAAASELRATVHGCTKVVKV